MSRFVRSVAIFILLYLAACAVLTMALPRLMAWHFTECTAASAICAASAMLLSYWWLAFLPVLAVATLLLDRMLARRRAT